MKELIVFDGIAPTYYWRNAGVVIGFELLTLIIEATLFYLLFVNKLERKMLTKAIATILVSNALTFIVCACIYTAFYGYEWLFTSWGTTPIGDFLMFLSTILTVPFFALSFSYLILSGGEDSERN